MSQHLWQKSIAAALGVAIAGSTALYSTTTNAQTPAATPAVGDTKPATTMPGKTKPATTKAKKSQTIVELAVNAKQFKNLVAAVKAADLVETLSGEGPFTLFAPNDAAFAKLPKGTLEKLLKPENKETLKKILTYHVVSGTVMSKDIKPGAVPTVEGSTVDVKVMKKSVMVNKARVLKADVKAANGVVHVIDNVILPPDLKL
jgi:uncharacterized surface protein with fasciclin (FAS1) repeats